MVLVHIQTASFIMLQKFNIFLYSLLQSLFFKAVWLNNLDCSAMPTLTQERFHKSVPLEDELL